MNNPVGTTCGFDAAAAVASSTTSLGCLMLDDWSPSLPMRQSAPLRERHGASHTPSTAGSLPICKVREACARATLPFLWYLPPPPPQPRAPHSALTPLE